MYLLNNKTLHRLLAPITCLLLLFSGALVMAAEEVNQNEQGIMLHGYDPVSYHLNGQPKPGNSSNQAEYQGGIYYFSSAANRDLFVSDKARYAPAYGGYCSYGVRVGKKFDIDPLSWKIVDKTLYLQLDQGTHIIWSKDIGKNIDIANKLWPKIKNQPSSALDDD